MTALVRSLPHPDTPQLVCGQCHRHTPATGGVAFSTPIGVRHRRKCWHCGKVVLTLEIVAGAHQVASLPVPASCPLWALRVLAAVARWAARWG